MKLQDQVCTLEQAKRLKQLGINQESYFSWMGDLTPRLMEGDAEHPTEYGPWIFLSTTKPANNQEADWRDDVAIKKPIAAAFTVAELVIMLPDYYLSWRFERAPGGEKLWIATAIAAPKPFGIDDIHTAHEFDRYGHTQAEALATLLISLLDCEVITVEEINKRLTA